MTSAEANFCWWCTRELAARPERPESSTSAKPLRIPVWAWVALGLLAAAAVWFFFLR
jgi:hypothetical protein